MSHRLAISEAANWIATAALLGVLTYYSGDIRHFATEKIFAAIDARAAAKAVPVEDVSEPRPGRSLESVELRADRMGHYGAEIEINGRPLSALVDTGATNVVLSYEDAQRVGIYVNDADFTIRTQTANGIGRAAPVLIERLALGPILLRNVQATVSAPGALHINLLGMAFVKRLSKFEVHDGTLTLTQ